MKKYLWSLVAGFALCGASAAFAATAVYPEYTVTYDDSTLLGGISFNSGSSAGLSFGWNFPDSGISVATDTPPASFSFDLPSFTVTPNAGYALGGSVGGFIGKLNYAAVGGGTATATVTGVFTVNGSASTPVNVSLTQTPNSSFGGFLSANASYAGGALTSIAFSGGKLNLSVTPGSGFAGISAMSQNQFRIDFAVAQVPEPESYGMLLAGLCLIGAIVRRRTRDA